MKIEERDALLAVVRRTLNDVEQVQYLLAVPRKSAEEKQSDISMSLVWLLHAQNRLKAEIEKK